MLPLPALLFNFWCEMCHDALFSVKCLFILGAIIGRSSLDIAYMRVVVCACTAAQKGGGDMKDNWTCGGRSPKKMETNSVTREKAKQIR